MRRLVVGLVLGTLAVVGCSPVTPETSARARALQLGTNGAPAQLQLPSRPATMSPFAPIGSAEQRLAQIHFRPLLAGSDGLIVPQIAAAWTSADGGRRLLVTTPRERWSDGHMISAADVVASLEAHLDPRSRSPFANQLSAIRGAGAFRAGRADNVSGLFAAGTRTVSITLNEPDFHFMERLIQVPIMPQHVYATREAMVTSNYRHARTGSGAYLLERWEPDGSVRYRPNPQTAAQGRQPRLLGVVARHVASADVIGEMTAGRLDVADTHELVDSALPPGVRLDAAPGNTLLTLTPAAGRVPDPRVRRALLAAINRSALVADGLGGRGRVANSLLFQAEWAEPLHAGGTAYDPDLARKVLAESGWAGRPVRVAVSERLGRDDIWRRVTDDLRRVGVDAQIMPVASDDPGPTDADLVAGEWTVATRHPALVTALVACGGSARTNIGQYCNPSLDAQMRTATASESRDQEVDRWREVSATLRDELPVLPLAVPDAAVATSATMGRIDASLVPLTGQIDQWVRVG